MNLSYDNLNRNPFTGKHTWVWTIGILALLGAGFFINRQAEINKEAEIEKAKIVAASQQKTAEVNSKAMIEKAKIEEEEGTKRTKERWEWTTRIPGLKGEAQKVE